MAKKGYKSRLCDAELKLALHSSGAVLIEGGKMVWKNKYRQ
jgi:hypothetical protein